MTTTAVTYRTGESARALRTVIVDDVRTTVVLVPSGRLEVLVAKLLHGTACAHSYWDAELGTSGDDFVVPVAQVVAQRPITVAVKATHKEY